MDFAFVSMYQFMHSNVEILKNLILKNLILKILSFWVKNMPKKKKEYAIFPYEKQVDFGLLHNFST